MIRSFSEMTEIPNTLFSETQRKELSANEKIKSLQKKAIQKWKDDLDANKLDIESQNKDHLRDLMIDALGYSRDKIKAETGEMNTRLDYSYTPDSGKNGVLFELKSRKKKLFEYQGYDKTEQSTPIDQAINYIEKNPHISYAVVTNFEQFVLITREDLRAQCYKFTFPPKGMKLLDSEIQEFVHFFSKNGIESGFIEKAKHATVIEEVKITDDFYKLYHQTRLMLVHSFEDKIEYYNAIRITQTYLNRLIFLFFAEDNGLIKKRIFAEGILSKLNSGNIKEKTTQISDHLQTLFCWMDSGSDEIDNKLGFNGEFFKEPMDRNAFFYDFQSQEFFQEIFKQVQIPNRIKLNKEDQTAIDRYDGKISPIIINLLKMASYNFKDTVYDELKDKNTNDLNDQISVNILGHIFEQSIGDLEELQKKETSQRKKEGVFYTPEYITRYICKNTIFPYLSKHGSTEPHQLVLEYKDSIHELEKKLMEIKILDPACGSGAFLVKAVDALISIYDEIQNFKQAKGAYVISKKGKRESGIAKQMTFDKEHEAENARGIIQNNIYGVDLNSESVEITKLSLFLKIATKNKRLIGLSQRIKVGNSIINDNVLDKKAFNWKTEFAEVLDDNIPKRGFDIVIGNPPYVRQELLSEIKPYLQKHYSVYHGAADLYVYFIEKGISLLKENGMFSIIVSNKFTKTDYGEKLRSFLLNYDFQRFIDFGDLRVFADASTYPSIVIIKNSKPNEYLNVCLMNTLDFSDLTEHTKNKFEKIKMSSFGTSAWSFSGEGTINILEKIKQNNINFGDFVDHKFYRGVTTGLDKVFLISKEQRNELIKKDKKSSEIIFPYLSGKEIKRNRIEWNENYIIFTRRGINISEYPSIEEYLLKFKKQLQPKKSSKEKIGRKPGKYNWYEIQDNTAYWKIFLEPGIIYTRMNQYSNFTMSPGNFFINSGGFQIQNNKYWLLSILNSKLINFYLKSVCPFVRGGYYDYRSQYVETIPITNIKEGRDKLENYQKNILQNYKQMLEIKNLIMNRINLTFKFEKISNKINNFYSLTFNEFLTEIFKFSKIKLSLDDQDEWEQYFNNKSQSYKKLENEIFEYDSKIDDIVFEMYGISKAEQVIIIQNLKSRAGAKNNS